MIRGKGNMVGEITDCYFYGKRQEAFIGKNLRDPMVRNYKKHEVLDLDVTLKNGLKVRVLRVWSKKDKKISFLVTNILRNQMKDKIVTKIQKVRWQILCAILKYYAIMRKLHLLTSNITFSMYNYCA